MVLGIFKIALHLRDRHVFMWQSVEILNIFSTLALKQIFWKTKTFFKKLENRFLFESTKIENTSFPFKPAISEANVKTNTLQTLHVYSALKRRGNLRFHVVSTWNTRGLFVG